MLIQKQALNLYYFINFLSLFIIETNRIYISNRYITISIFSQIE